MLKQTLNVLMLSVTFGYSDSTEINSWKQIVKNEVEEIWTRKIRNSTERPFLPQIVLPKDAASIGDLTSYVFEPHVYECLYFTFGPNGKFTVDSMIGDVNNHYAFWKSKLSVSNITRPTFLPTDSVLKVNYSFIHSKKNKTSMNQVYLTLNRNLENNAWQLAECKGRLTFSRDIQIEILNRSSTDSAFAEKCKSTIGRLLTGLFVNGNSMFENDTIDFLFTGQRIQNFKRAERCISK